MSLSYRPEVDGLRFVAVGIVILHHLSVMGFGGGFVGVDVFFVISGYLITSLIMLEIKNQSFSFSNFYKRRLIRLAPAYFIVLLVTFGVAFMLMLPAELKSFSESAIYSTLFSANFYMWDVVGGYFGSGADTTPLLHLWSLAVEEQFYLIWPLVLFISFRWLPKWTALLVLVFFIGALVVSEWGAIHYRAAAYYLMPTRAFELLLGALLALAPIAWFTISSRYVRAALSGLGLILIVYSTMVFNNQTWFPGLNALIPCVGAALVIAFTRAEDPVVGYFLSNKVAVVLGKISYPAYLWHWPIVAYLNLQLIELTFVVSFLVVVLTFLLAAATYAYIELPFRQVKNFSLPKVFSLSFVVPTFLLVICSGVLIRNDGFPQRFDDELNLRAEAVLSYAHAARGRCNEGPVRSPLDSDACRLGVDKEEVDILLLGDSHANHFTGMIDVLAKDAGLRAYDITQSQTPFLIGVDRYYEQNDVLVKHNNFSDRNKFIESQVIPRGYTYVVLAASFNAYNTREVFSEYDRAPVVNDSAALFQSSLNKTINLIVENGSVPVLVKGNPVFDFDVSNCTLNNKRFGLQDECSMRTSTYQNDFLSWGSFVDELKASFPQMIVIDPAVVMCNEQICFSEIDSIPLYKDRAHLNYLGSELVGRKLLEVQQNPFSLKEI